MLPSDATIIIVSAYVGASASRLRAQALLWGTEQYKRQNVPREHRQWRAKPLTLTWTRRGPDQDPTLHDVLGWANGIVDAPGLDRSGILGKMHFQNAIMFKTQSPRNHPFGHLAVSAQALHAMAADLNEVWVLAHGCVRALH